MKPRYSAHGALSEAERKKRKLFLRATLVTCLSSAMVFGLLHVVKLGSNRMNDMRANASYNLDDETKHIRAAGEDIVAHQQHESKKSAASDDVYALSTLDALLSKEKWAQLDEMVAIPAGEFQMGSDNPRTNEYNKPQHPVSVAAFKIDKYPVTNAEYAKFVALTKHRPPLDWVNGKIPDNKLMHPVVMVSWYDARDYCAYEHKRLPSEEEWEKAARGPNDFRWPWGNAMNPDFLNTYDRIGSTTAVDRYPLGKSGYGVFDMAGNVSEWTASNFEPYPNSKANAMTFVPKRIIATTGKDRGMKVGELMPKENGHFKVRRGGSWKSDPFATSAFHRNFSEAHYASDFFGFRCAESAGAKVVKANKSS